MKTVIGYIAHQVLERADSALVSGISSRGLFLQPEGDWTLYLSREGFRGPLTLNLTGKDPSWPEKVQTGSPVQFTPGTIRFPDQDLSISIKAGEIWHPPLPSATAGTSPEKRESLINQAHQLAPGHPLIGLLTANPLPIPGVPGFIEKTRRFQQALESGDPEMISDVSSGLLGLGPGLTPLGDDYILGAMLTLNRWVDPHQHNNSAILNNGSTSRRLLDLKKINRIILDDARAKTTRLSASLLACAVEGAADERLIQVLDGLFSDQGVPDPDLQDLLSWGSTSGIAVLAGMLAVLS